jgi:hypothetical protein
MCGKRGIGGFMCMGPTGVLCAWVLQGFCVDGSYRGFVLMGLTGLFCLLLYVSVWVLQGFCVDGSYRVILFAFVCLCMGPTGVLC